MWVQTKTHKSLAGFEEDRQCSFRFGSTCGWTGNALCKDIGAREAGAAIPLPNLRMAWDASPSRSPLFLLLFFHLPPDTAFLVVLFLFQALLPVTLGDQRQLPLQRRP